MVVKQAEILCSGDRMFLGQVAWNWSIKIAALSEYREM